MTGRNDPAAAALLQFFRKDGKSARRCLPYVRHCVRSHKTVLAAGNSIYDSVFLSAGRNGWDLAEPGDYTLQVAHLDGEDIVWNALRVRVAPPRSFDEEALAQDFFSDEVGRILTFDGSPVLTNGNDVWRELIERFPDSRAAVHARVALGNAVAVERKRLEIAHGGGPAVPAHMAGGRIMAVPPDEPEARKHLGAALAHDTSMAAETLGHIDYNKYSVKVVDWLVAQRDVKQAADVLNSSRASGMRNAVCRSRVMSHVV
jgi:hypothetical protein